MTQTFFYILLQQRVFRKALLTSPNVLYTATLKGIPFTCPEHFYIAEIGVFRKAHVFVRFSVSVLYFCNRDIQQDPLSSGAHG